MKQLRDQMEAIHKKERAQVLATLTASQRSMVAKLVGELAIAENPDPKGVAAKVDAALSASQKSTIFKIHQDSMSQMHVMMSKQMSQFHPPGGPPEQREFGEHGKPSAGELVLRILGPVGGMPDVMFMRRGGMSGHYKGPPRMNPPSGAPNPTNT